MEDWVLRFNNLVPKHYKVLGSSLKKNLKLSEWQSYMPIMSLFFHVHNTRNSHKCITFDNRYILKHLNNQKKKDKGTEESGESEESEEYDTTSNKIYNAVVWDNRNNKDMNLEVFCKVCPLLDPVTYMQGNYNVRLRRHQLLPSNYNHNTFTKINCIDNSAYIDAFFCYIGSYLREKHYLPCFPLYYGSFNGIIDEFLYDISDEYYSLKSEAWFEKNLGQLFSLDIGVAQDDDDDDDDDEKDEKEEQEEKEEQDEKKEQDEKEEKPKIEELPDSDEEEKSEDEGESGSESGSEDGSESSSKFSESNDYIAVFEDFPVQTIFMEKCEKTLGEMLEGEYQDKTIKSILFQTIFGLAFLQKHFDFTHNDLHVNNIMVTKTEKKFLIYRANRICYRVPTCGYIAKIIDFGRSIFTFRDRTYFNDVFSRYGEAEGQYTYPKQEVPFYKSEFVDKDEKGEPIKNETVLPNPNFDITRLATTIMDDFVKTEQRRIRTEQESKKVEENKESVESDIESDIESEDMDKYYPDTDIFNFLKECVTDDEGVNLHLEDESFDLYKRIAKHAKNATPKDLLKHKFFEKYKVQRKTLKNCRVYSL